MAAREPYRTHRQQHLGDFLDRLQANSLIIWELAKEDSPTLFRIAEAGSRPMSYRTWEAEILAADIARREGIPWLPVPYPGGLDVYNETVSQIKKMKGRTGRPHSSRNPETR